jgi:hypothetical protein
VPLTNPLPPWLVGNFLASGSGEEITARMQRLDTITLSTGVMVFGYFSARLSEAITQVRMRTGTGSITPTLVRLGLYSVDAAGAGTLVASTANDTSLLTGNNTTYTKAFSAGFTKVASQRYAFGVLIVGGTPGQILSVNLQTGVEAALAPRVAGALSGLSDIPGSFVDASMVSNSIYPYAALVP